MLTPTSRLKYRNVPTTLGGLRFASKAEARRYGELVLLQKAGVITDIVVQPKFPLKINGQLICTYVADFSYMENNNLCVEDVKSRATRTPVYIIKVKLLQILLEITVREIGL